jgi:hypothetical protein
MINAVLSKIPGLLGGIITPLIDNPATGVIVILDRAFTVPATNLVTDMGAIFKAIASLFSLIINVQQNGFVDGMGQFTEIPLQLNLLSGTGTLNIGKVVVGPNYVEKQ